MNENLTELVFILDRSGSMTGLESDTIGGFNSLLAKQREEPGEAVVTTALFDNRYELLHDRIPLEGVVPITGREYFVRGSTALLDAIGSTINKIDRAQRNTVEEQRAGKTLVVIITDGLENASREFRIEEVRDMIARRKEKGWEFLFLGANIDAIAVADRYGIGADKAVRYASDPAGTRLNYERVSYAASDFRRSRSIADDWKSPIEAHEKNGK